MGRPNAERRGTLTKAQGRILAYLRSGGTIHQVYHGTLFASDRGVTVRRTSIARLKELGLIRYEPSKRSLGGKWVLDDGPPKS